MKLGGVSNKNGKEVCKYIKHRFIGSCKFMTSGLDKPASNLDEGQWEKKFLSLWGAKTKTYKYIDSWEKFEETKNATKECILQQA